MLFPLYDRIPHNRFPWLTLWIITINVVVMGWQTQIGFQESIDISFRYGFIPKRASQIDSGKPLTVEVPKVDRWGNAIPNAPKRTLQLSTDPSAVYLTFLTTMFLHGGWFHVVTNMWMLWVFGNNMEDRLGHFMFLCYYIVGGLTATVCHWAVVQSAILPGQLASTPVIGASGAVAAVLGGYAISYPKAKVRTLVFVGIPLLLDLPALVVLGFWFVLQMLAGLGLFRELLDTPIAFWAHVGGFIAGIALLPLFILGTSPPDTNWRKEADEMFHFDDPQERR